MTTTIASNIPGRAIAHYDLLNQLQQRYGLTRRQTHDDIHALLDQLADLGDNPVVDERPMRPELLDNNPQDIDVYYWIEITDQAAQDIRDSFATTYAAEDTTMTTTAYTHAIETSTDGEVWQAAAVTTAPEEHDGDADEYAAAVLTQWLTDEHPEGAPVDGDGNPLIRCRAYPAGSDLVAGEAYPAVGR